MYKLLTVIFVLLTLALLAVAFPGCASTSASSPVAALPAALSVAVSWLAAHPIEALTLAYVMLSGVNGMLPRRVRSGPVGRVLHTALDRISALTRSDAAGTLKWPIVATSLLRPSLAISVETVSGPDESERPTLVPGDVDESSHAARSKLPPGTHGLMVLALVILAGACHPNLPPVVGCHVGAYACVDGRPVVCSQSQRLEPAGDRSCASVGAVCVVDDGGPAHCAPAVDASTDGGAE